MRIVAMVRPNIAKRKGPRFADCQDARKIPPQDVWFEGLGSEEARGVVAAVCQRAESALEHQPLAGWPMQTGA